MDSKLVELIGRNYLTVELLKAGLEVAIPVRDRGIDLIAYVDIDADIGCFRARPIQLKAASDRSFSVDMKYAKFPDLLMAYVWGLRDISSVESYLMTHEESMEVGVAMGWANTESWKKGYYMTANPSTKLLKLLAPFRATEEVFRKRIAGAGPESSAIEADRRRVRVGPINVLLMVHELHKRGYERLRIVPGMAASGMHWRVTILPKSRVLQSHGAMSHDWTWGGPEPFYTSGQEQKYFGWDDAQDDAPRELADRFLARYAELAQASHGSDKAYAGWYLEMLEKAKVGELPVAYADWYQDPDPRWLPTTAGFDTGLPMPPPGEADGSVDDPPD